MLQFAVIAPNRNCISTIFDCINPISTYWPDQRAPRESREIRAFREAASCGTVIADLILLMQAALDSAMSLRRAASARPRARSRSHANGLLLVSMLLATLAVAALAYWDAERESAAALDDFAREQVALAQGVTAGLRLRQSAAEKGPAPGADIFELPSLLSMLKPIERPNVLRVFVKPPTEPLFVSTDSTRLNIPAFEQAIRSGATSLRLERSAARELGLPERTAMAGLGTFRTSAAGDWALAVVATAEHERDRAIRANVRLLTAVAVTVALVLVFGGIALKKQRSELELSRELAVAAVEKMRDERLVRADKLATLGALATGIAHEVSTPLGVILGRAEQALARLPDDERSRHAIEVIIEQTDRISRVIRGFLGLARGDAPRLEHVSPALLVRKSIELVEHRFEKASVHLASDVPAEVSSIACEQRLFEQVLVNLLLNACDACKRGGHVEIKVRADEDRVAFVITDDGQGIDPVTASKVTEPFFTTKPFGEGSGLGLAIANEIVKHHSGTLQLGPRCVTSPHDRTHASGTRAVVEVPAVEVSTHGTQPPR